MSSLAEQLPPSSDPHADGLEHQFDVLKLDYERTLTIADGLVRTSATLRVAGLAAYTTLLGLGIQEKSWALSIAAGMVVLLVGYTDLRSGVIYRSAVRRANMLERLFQHRLRALDRPYDPYPKRRLRAEIERYRFGALGQLPAFRVADLRSFTPRSVLAFYGALVVGAAIAAAIVP